MRLAPLKIFNTLWSRFFALLLLVSLVGLSAALYLRQMMLRDFASYMEGQRLDLVYLVSADLEGSYEKEAGWDGEEVAKALVRAYMLGMQTRVRDADGGQVMDTSRALAGLSPLMARRVLGLSGEVPSGEPGGFSSYPLFLAGRHIGDLETSFLARDREKIFVRRSNRFLMLSFLVMGGIAITASLLVSRRLTRPLMNLLDQTRAIRRGDFENRAEVSGGDEIGKLSEAFNDMAGDLQLQEDLRRKLIANVAHELRTPLAVMRSELEAMADGVLEADAQQLQSLYEETGRLAGILDGIDDLTQAQASSLSMVKQEVDLGALMNHIRDRFAAKAAEKGVSLEVAAGNGIRAWADPDRLGQILINLVANALRATSGGGTVTLAARVEPEGTAVQVLDTGRGIAAADLPHIFERFYRGEGGGLGLGLAIVRELVEAHDGGIEIESAEGRGTTVTVTLPEKP